MTPQSLGGSTVILYLYVDDVDAFVHRAVENGAKLIRSVELMPHGDRVGKIEDPFGYTWMVATRTED
jgi:PhnB protein